MAMNSRDYELIALGHVLTRYRLTGQLPKINGEPFNLDEFKKRLFAGVDDCDGNDTNVNNSIKTESNVTIIKNRTINRNQPLETSSTPSQANVGNLENAEISPEKIEDQSDESSELTQPNLESDEITSEPTEEDQSNEPDVSLDNPDEHSAELTVGGRLFQYFNRDRS